MTHHLKPVTKVSDKLKGMLNDAIAREMAVGIQYMWQHIQVIGVKGIAVQAQLKKTAITEMKHAEAIAERLWYLEGTPAEVNKTSRGPQVILSRTHRNMLRRLFELEVPEIFNGLVEIKAMAREAGSRSKIGVSAVQDGIDPVGACVGQRGVRIQAIVNELNGEKIDVVEWSPDVGKFVANSLSPAKVLMVHLTEEPSGDKVANVVVDDKQLSLAIGKEGQNARLAAKLTGWRIDIKSETQVADEAKEKAEAEAARVAAMTPEEIAAEETAQAIAELPAAAPEEPAVIQPEAVEQVTAEPTEQAPAAAEPELVAEEAAPGMVQVETSVAETPAELETETVPGTEKTFAEAWEEFEAEEEAVEGETPEEALKRKADRRKRQTLVFDEKLGKVVAKRKRKAGRARDWQDQIEE